MTLLFSLKTTVRPSLPEENVIIVCKLLISCYNYIFTRFDGGNWITLVQGGGRWEVRVKGNLTTRPDNGRINISPATAALPVYRLQHGATHTITIPGKETS